MKTGIALGAGLLCLILASGAFAHELSAADLTGASLATLSADLASHRVTSQQLVAAYEERIKRLNPEIHAVIALNPRAMAEARATNLRLAGPDGIDRLLKEHRVEALISPTQNPAAAIDLVNGDAGIGPGDSSLPAIAGYPYITVPMGKVQGLPVGLSFIGPKWSEARLLGFAYAYEHAARTFRPPTFAPNMQH